MDNVKKLQEEVTQLLENEVDRITINKILEVIEQVFAIGLQEGMKVNWEEHD